MPLYEYRCRSCDHHLEELQRMTDPPLRKCPECGKHRLVQVIGVPALRTDTSFLASKPTLRDQFQSEGELMRVVNSARKLGHEPSAASVYNPFLANQCGDPAAFIPHTNPISHVKKLAISRGTGCNGAVNVKAPAPKDPEPTPRLAKDIVDQHVARLAKQDPGVLQRGPKAMAKLRESIIEKHAFSND